MPTVRNTERRPIGLPVPGGVAIPALGQRDVSDSDWSAAMENPTFRGWVESGRLEVKGWLSKLVEPDDSVESLREQLDARGIDYDKRWGIAKLKAALEV